MHPDLPDSKEDDMADEVPTRVRSIVEKVLEAEVTDQIARRGREIAAAVGQATEAVSERAEAAWNDSAPQRRDAEKAARRASRDALSLGRRTWQKEVRPSLRDLWSRRSAAIATAGAAVPVGRGIVDDAAVRLGLRKRSEQRHWMAFFLGLLIGAAAGAVIAILTTPKPGREMRDELAERAREAADRAREAAGSSDWVPLFQRPEENGSPEPTDTELPSEPVTDAAPSPAVDAATTESEEQS
jgi:gas vesicle protein